MSATQGKILVIRGGAIGDFILTLPALSALRRQFPHAHLEVLGYPHIAQLALAGGLAQRMQSIESRAMAGFFARGGELAEDLRDYFSEFDVIISYLYDPDEIFQTNIARCSQAQYISGPHRPDNREDLHATEVFLKPLVQLAIFDAETTPRLEVDPADDAALANGRWLAVHPGSGSDRKNWPEENWLELLHHLARESTSNILLVGGEAERGRLERLSSALPPGRVKLMQSAPLAELARALAACDAFVGHDSGISHLAAAVGTPSLILWGYTNESVWRPRGRELTVLRDADGLASLPVAVVTNQVEQMLARAGSDAGGRDMA